MISQLSQQIWLDLAVYIDYLCTYNYLLHAVRCSYACTPICPVAVWYPDIEDDYL